MKIPSNIYLVGPMGAGKTTVGRHLARALTRDFVDSDRELEEHTGASVALIFDIEGEDGFRRREREMLAELCRREGVVMATGGGAVLAAENRALLSSRGFVVHLDAPVELLVDRTAQDRNRPLMQVPDPRARVEELLRERQPLYREVADLVVTSNLRSARHVAREIVAHLEAM